MLVTNQYCSESVTEFSMANSMKLKSATNFEKYNEMAYIQDFKNFQFSHDITT